jgi:DNA/RNA endonuclease G (NUC1)
MTFEESMFMPEAHAANQYLWVSVEDAGGNKFYGGQVLEVVVTDPAINRLDEAYVNIVR